MSRKNSLGVALAFLLLFSYISIFEVTSTNIATATQSPSSISDTNSFVPSLWYSPDGSLPKDYDTRAESIGVISTANEQSYEPLPPAMEAKNQIWLIVNQNIYPTIKTTLMEFSNDIQSSGYNVSTITLSSGTSALIVRNLLQQNYKNGSLQGAILIGNLPTAWYEMTNPSPWGYEKFPIDYYYMDLDCNWTDTNGNGVFDNCTFPMRPEIWVARIDASGITGNETQYINNYLTKDHNYRIGNLVASRQALVYVDDDWTSYADNTNREVQQAYKNTILVKDYAATNATDYENRLYSNSYEWVHLMCHGSSKSHTFKINGTWQSESVSSSYYSTANPKALFYNLFVCSGTRFTETNNLAGSIIFGNNWGLLAVGSTKTGSMLNFGDFYQPLGQGKSIGDAFKLWSINWADSDPKWFYGMNIVGDPLLKTSQYMHTLNVTVPAPTLSPSGSTTVGTSLSLSVTITGEGVTPTGTATFQVNINGGNWNTIGSPVSLNSAGFVSTTYSPMTAASYQFRVVYSGDINYNGATGSTTNLTVNVGKPLNEFVFSAISSPQNTGTAFSITITAKDANGNTITSYNETNTLTVSLGTISPTSTTAFSGGVWSGSVALSQAGTGLSISTSGGGKSGTSNIFSVNPGDLVLFSDNFDNLSNWTLVNGVWSVSGGVLQGVAPSENCLIWAGDTAWTNYQLSAYGSKLNSGNVIGVVVRYTNPDNFYWMGLGSWGHKFSISKMDNGTGTELASSGLISEVEVGRWYMISAVVDDSTLQLFVDGVKVLEVQDSSLKNGAMGFITYNGTMQARHLSIQSKNLNIKIQTKDGGYALAGYTNSFGAGGKDFWIVKVDTVGNQQWNKTYGGPSDEVAYSVIQTKDGGYALAGYTNSFGAGGKDFWIVKVDTVGNQQWNKTYGGPSDEVAYSVIQTKDGGYILSGSGLNVNVPVDGPPSTIHNYNGLWHTVDFSINLSAIDDEFTIVRDTYYKINDDSTKTINNNGLPFINTEGANNKLEYWSVDNLGHEELPHNVLNGIKLDKTAPTGFILINDGDAFTSSFSVALSSGANELTSGVYQVRYSNDDVWDIEAWEFPTVSKSWTLTSGDGIKTVYCQIKDNAGLVSSTYSDTITLSTTFPGVSIVINNGDASTLSVSVTLALTYSDASGVYEVRYSNDDVWDNENWEMPTKNRTWSLTSGEGTKSVYYQVKNYAGLTSITYSDTIILETTPTSTPTATPTPSPSLSPSVTPTVRPTVTSMPIASPIPTSIPTLSPTAIPVTPSPSPNQPTSPSTSPLSQPTETPLYLYAVVVFAIAVVSATTLIIAKRR